MAARGNDDQAAILQIKTGGVLSLEGTVDGIE
jgi:hypothetical protein